MLDQGLESMTLAHGKVVAAGPIAVPELEYPDELREGLLEAASLPNQGGSVGGLGGLFHS
jgi:hypothetical protein